jgi:hypothetical protein
MRDVSYACARALHSLKWRFVHKYSDDAAAENQWSSIRAKPRQFRPCPFEIDTYTENVITRIIKSFHSSCLLLRRKSLHMRLARTLELPGIVKLGLRIWRESSWGAVATDKDGGFCIMPKLNILSVKKAILVNSESYKQVSMPLSSLVEELDSELALVCNSASKHLDDKKLLLALSSGFSASRDSWVAKLQILAKTHKLNMSFRAVHALSSARMDPLMKFICHVLDPIIRDIPVLVKDSFDFVRRIRNLCIGYSVEVTRLIKFDVKDFFMSGGHAALVNHSGKHIVCPNLRAAFTDVATFVLDSQFVAIMDPEGCIGHTYKVVSGTGMGLRSSGHLSNVAFWSMVYGREEFLRSQRGAEELWHPCILSLHGRWLLRTSGLLPHAHGIPQSHV